MNETVEKAETAPPFRPLPDLAPLIREALAAGDKAGLEHYRLAGELLLEAKAQIEKGAWQAWLDRHFHLSRTVARQYMKLAGMTEERRGAATTLSGVTRPNAHPGHRATWHEPVKRVVKSVDMKVLAAEEQSRERERKVTHNLAHQLIDVGYKILAAKLHPDHGGSAEAMARLSKVRNLLKDSAFRFTPPGSSAETRAS